MDMPSEYLTKLAVRMYELLYKNSNDDKKYNTIPKVKFEDDKLQ